MEGGEAMKTVAVDFLDEEIGCGSAGKPTVRDFVVITCLLE